MPLLCLKVICVLLMQDNHRITSKSGSVHFRSEAPLELIQAESSGLRGIIDTQTREFAFIIPIESFQGFNSNLQREHFLENYMEISKFPRASYEGRIIDEVDFSEPGTYRVRAKGTFSIHGVARERIIESTIVVNDEKILVQARFRVPLEDHDIVIPKIVNQKIAREIDVSINAEF